MKPFRSVMLITALFFFLWHHSPVMAQKPDDQPSPRPVDGIENVWRLTDDLFSGGDPNGEKGLARLKALGFRTIISVDGAVPDVEAARNLGIRYAHIPFGYDGIPKDSQLLLIRSFLELPKPIYLHCHHGKHRGPAGAAVMARFGLNWSSETAQTFMKLAGTSSDYPGLYASVTKFEKPDAATLAAIGKDPIPEQVEVADMVEMMVQIDTRFDRLKDWLKNETANQPSVKGIDPDQEAIQLIELVKESARLPECRDQPVAFQKGFDALTTDLDNWVRLIREQKRTQAKPRLEYLSELTGQLKRATGQCNACHKAYRN